MLLATTFDERTNKTETTLYNSWDEYHKSVFSPAIDTLSIIPLSVHGKTYAERKASAEQIAIDFSNSECYSISWNELAIISAFFEKIGKRYGFCAISVKIVFAKRGRDKPMNKKIAFSAHTIISGSTGSGKSVLMNNFLCALIREPSYAYDLWIVDPKRVDYIDYKPLCRKYATEPAHIDKLLQDAVNEMEKRYCYMMNRGLKEYPLSHLYIICDEFGQVLRSPKAVSALDQLLRLGRAARVHVIAANQNAARTNGCPSFLRVNFTCQIGLHCVDKIASRQATGFTGCESLQLYGYAYCMTPQDTKPVLYQIPKKTDNEIRQRISEAIKMRHHGGIKQ